MPGTRAVTPVVATYGNVRLRWHARQLRGDRTLAEAARTIGVNRDELSRIERGETVQIRFETLAKLLDGYRCDLTDLIEVTAAESAPEAAPWAAPLAALRAGRIRAGAPGRPDPDSLDEEPAVPGVAAAAQLTEGEDDRPAGWVRRNSFRTAPRA